MIKPLLLVLSATLQFATATQASAESKALTTPAHSMAVTGWQLVRAAPSGNVVVSPASIWMALGMVHAGASGQTAREIAEALGAPNQQSFFADHVAAFQTSLAANKDARLQLYSANRLWVQADWRLQPAYLSVLTGSYRSSSGVMDFRNQPNEARDTINRWVANETRQHIKELLPSDVVTRQTRMVLTNALFMKAPWKHAFKTSSTLPQDFYINAHEKVSVPTMHQTITTMAGRWGSGDAASTVVELPYGDGQLKMVLYVPDKVDGLAAVLESLPMAHPVLREQSVHIGLPKWTATQRLDLKPLLQKMGIRQVFQDGKADLSGMRSENDMFVSEVLHKIFVEVNEVGTEAAAATAVFVATTKSALSGPLDVRADRPFAWAIVDTRTNTLLFTGVMRDPRS